MKRTLAAAATPFVVVCGLVLIAFSSAQAAPTPGITNGNVVLFQGDQSQGVNLQVSPGGPATLVVSNLSPNFINPGFMTPGVQIAGADSSQNFTAIVDTNVSISTFGDGAHGIFAENGGGFVASYELVTNSFTITTNMINGTNVIVDGTNSITITTNVVSGGGNNYTNVVPAGGATVINHGSVATTGNNAHGIFAESIPGNITLTLSGNPVVNQAFGPGGPVIVFNSGNITTSGTNAHGIFAQSLGGFGPENSYSGGAGFNVTVQTAGGNITNFGADSIGIFAQSRGGDNQGGESGGVGGDGRTGGLGGDAGQVSVTGTGNITTFSHDSGGIFVLSQAGNGGNGGNGGTLGGSGGNGGSGGKGGNVSVNGAWNIETYGSNSTGIAAQSLGGIGGSGGDGSHFIDLGGGNGGGTGDGGTVSVVSGGNIHTRGPDSLGIFARSLGGFAGSGGNSYNPFVGDAGNGNSAGAGRKVEVVNSGDIITEGKDSQAIYAESVGGGGGGAGSSGALVSLGSSGGAGGNAGDVTVTNTGTLLTFGAGSHGIEAQSLGGGGGDGGNAAGLVALGGTAANASTGQVVTVYNTGTITTWGSNSYAILAQSIGGGGGNAGSSSGAAALGASGGGGGDGGAVHVFNSGAFQNLGTNSYGIFAQSIGGGGGNGGGSAGLGAIGGSGGTASQGDVVSVVNSGSIFSADNAIFAQSIGGGGGNGGNGSGWISVGGSGTGGGNGSRVTVNNTGNLETLQENASALLAQSIGGGGGNGGNSIAVGAFGSLAIGGSGGAGGNGNAVGVTSGTNYILTLKNNSYGIDAESVGGGGGNGGYAASAAVGDDFSAAISLGGNAGGGGSASNVTVASGSAISTYGTNSHGIFAQSIGGGGGAGGFAVAVSGGNGVSLSLSMGGTGGGGGNGGTVEVTNTGAILTATEHSYGILAQSVGGGGGDGGFSVAASVSSGVAASLSFGGTGGTGGVARAVSLLNSGNITTYGADSDAIMAQSVGGGGGSGGFSIAGSIGGSSSGAIGASFGGSGAGAGSGDTVFLSNSGTITTYGDRSVGILAQSVGGGGGNGGFSIFGGISKTATLGLSFGGNGGVGGNSGSVTLTNSGAVTTYGVQSHGVMAESVGGGGGNGGFSLAGGVTQGNESVNAVLAMGGNGSTGGVANAVFIWNRGAIETFGSNADGIFAQSVGGGGGSGGFAGAGTLGLGSNSLQMSVAIGGNGGDGNLAGSVLVNNTAQILTHNNDSIGIFAQSVGGGGGNGGMSFAGGFTASPSDSISIAIGGHGGTGGDANSVTVNNSGSFIGTAGDRSHGILAQSVGGGGGNGGLAAAVDFGLGTSDTVVQFAVSIGGDGGAGGKGGNVSVTGSNSVVTMGQDAYGVFAQSVGGGGGSGGFSVAATGVLGAAKGTNRALTVAVGGSGGSGNDGGSVLVNRSGSIETFGDGSYGIIAQSIGGGGGDGGGARSFSLFTRGSRGGGNGQQGSDAKSINISVGGHGGDASSGGDVIVTNVGDVITHGADAYGIFAQSVGGGGGAGGNAHSSTDNLLPIPIPGIDDLINKAISTDADSLQVVVGGSGGTNGNGRHVIVNDTGAISTFGDGSYGIFAQSVGGGGGVAGNGGIGKDGLLGIGGSGGDSGDGGQVDVIHTGDILTAGAGSAGIFVQSVGGGGGVAGNMDRGLKDLGINAGTGFAFGGDGGSAGNGSAVNVTNVGNITTGGNGADGIYAQSVGGGGGLLGDLGNDLPVLSMLTDFAGSVGGAGNGGDVTVSHTGFIFTYGTNSTGIFAQSAGGTNGVGGNVTVTLNGSNYVNGVDADGIYAQSGGGATVVTPPIPTGPNALHDNVIAEPNGGPLLNGNVTVNITSNSIVQGGSGIGVGVRIVDGVNNALENYGTVTTVNALNGTAVSGGIGNDKIDNFGTIVGSVDLGAGGNAFNNMTGAVFFAGNTINLGAGNTLGNAGIISLGDVANMQVAALNGNFLQTSNGSLQIKFASPASYDALNVSGSATLDGNLSVFRFNNYLPTKGLTFTVLTASNIIGEFSSVFDPYAGNYALRLQSIYSTNNLVLQVVQDSFTQFAHTGNQRSVSKNLNSFSGLGGTGGDPRGAELIAFLDTQNATQLPGDFDLISPDELGSMFDLDFASVNRITGDIRQRMAEIRAGNHEGSGGISLYDSHGNIIQLASASEQLPPMHMVKVDPDWGIFAFGNGQYVNVNGSTNAHGYHFDSAGVTLGADRMVSEKTAMGFTLDYAGTKAGLFDNGTVNVDSGRAGAYGTWFDKDSYVESSIGAGYSHYTTSRSGLGGTATGSTDGFDFDALLGGGFNWRCGYLIFGPQADVHYTFVRVNEFTETGSLAPLHLLNNDSQSLLTRLGPHVGYQWYWDNVLLRPSLQLAWQHEFLDNDRAIDSRLATGAGNVFTVDSPKFGRDSLSVDVYLTVQWTQRFSTYLGYHGDFLRNSYSSHSGSGGFSVTF